MKMRSVLLALSCFFLILNQPAVRAGGEGKPPEVQVSQPLSQMISEYEDFTGRTQAVQSVEVRARVSGYLTKIAFKDGDEVKKGDLLFELDPGPFQAQLKQAEAALQLAQTQHERARKYLMRAEALRRNNSISQQDYEQTKAQSATSEAAVKTAEVNHKAAVVNFEYTKLRSPIDGRIGRALLSVGNLVKADTTQLATIVSLDPMYVYFTIDERTLLRLAKLLRESKGEKRSLPIQVGLSGETGFAHTGKLDFVDSRVDPTTGTILGRGVLPNSKHLMLPGMFVRVRLSTSPPTRALLIDGRALSIPIADGADEKNKKNVLVVNDQNKVEVRTVELRAHGKLWVVSQGLTPTDWVIVKASKPVKAGMAVAPVQVAMQVGKGQNDVPPAKERSAKLKELVKERHVLLAKVAEAVTQQYQSGRADLNAVNLARKAAFEAGLEACENSAQRIDLLRKEVKSAEDSLRATESRFKSGSISQYEVLQARAAVLEMQIRLLREEEK